jgi:hypothetical protein
MKKHVCYIIQLKLETILIQKYLSLYIKGGMLRRDLCRHLTISLLCTTENNPKKQRWFIIDILKSVWQEIQIILWLCLCVEYTVTSYSFVAFPEFDVSLYGTHTNSYSVAKSEILLETVT